MNRQGTADGIHAGDVHVERMRREAISLRIRAEQAFTRVGGAPLVPGNAVRLLRDAAENYPAWLEAIGAAERTIHFESYIIGC